MEEGAEEVLELCLFPSRQNLFRLQRSKDSHDLSLLVYGWNWYRKRLQKSASQRPFGASSAMGDRSEVVVAKTIAIYRLAFSSESLIIFC